LPHPRELQTHSSPLSCAQKLRRPLTAAHRRQINRESSPDRLTFQIARTTISPNYPGEAFETPDHEVLVVSTDVPPQDGETYEQRVKRDNANAARAIRCQQELAPAASTIEQPPGNIGMQAPADPAAPQLHQQRNEPRRNRLRARDLLRSFEHDGHEVYNSPKPTWGLLLPH
jgi:hypothetical protein